MAEWAKVSAYCIAQGDKRICFVRVNGKGRFEYWREGKFVSAHPTVEAAKAAAKE